MLQKLLLTTLLLAPLMSAATIHPSEHVARKKQCPLAKVCFVIDQSGSIEPHYGTEIEFVVGIAAALDNRKRDVSYSAVGFSDDAKVIQKGTKRLPVLIESLVGMEPSFGQTNVYAGIEKCFSLVGSKTGKNVIVVLSDGARTAGQPASQLAGKINRSGKAFIMAVGIGQDVDHSQLTPLVATGSFYFPSTFKDLPKKVPELVEGLCG